MMPVDSEPSGSGNIQLRAGYLGEPPLVEIHTVKARTIDYRTSHFNTCPMASHHRKKDVQKTL
jgi:hypothetical protein